MPGVASVLAVRPVGWRPAQPKNNAVSLTAGNLHEEASADLFSFLEDRLLPPGHSYKGSHTHFRHPSETRWCP